MPGKCALVDSEGVDMATIPRRPLGKTGVDVSLLGVGGFHIGVPDEREGIAIIHQAIDAGANFLDNAWEYNDGESERRMGKALAQDSYRQKAFLMTKDCAHDRKALNSMWKLEQSLKRLQTDYLDPGKFMKSSGTTIPIGSSRRAAAPRRC
jgi:aryl-alcohol dehydrogenase-like predicted oxidoreductase